MKRHWRKVRTQTNEYLQYVDGFGVLGTVAKADDGKYIWCARVMLNCRLPNMTSKAPIGKVLTLDDAYHIVEFLCKATGTIEEHDTQI